VRNPQEILENLNKQAIKHRNDKSFKVNELYKHLLNPLMYKHAYSQIYANKDSGTAGIDNETADGFSDEKINRILVILKDETYQPKPVKRLYIDKKNDKTKKRPLGIPTMTDRYVQEIINQMLTIIYEPLFSDKSFGFRQGRSCHNAIHAIQTTFQGSVWFIEGNIRGFFDNINHNVMIELLRKKIDDERFIRLIRKFLNAGYLEEWTYHKTYSGTPQGGIISPILANIYLNELDKYVEQIQDTFNKGSYQSIPVTSEYRKATRIRRMFNEWMDKIKLDESGAHEHIKNKEFKGLLREKKKIKLQQINTIEVKQHAYKHRFQKLCYLRYADDFIIGIIGNKTSAENVRDKINDFLADSLKLELSQEKTLITYSANKAKFLSYEISVYKRNLIQKAKALTGNKELRAEGKGQIRLTMSKNIVPRKLIELDVIRDINAKTWKAKRNTKIINNSDLEIIDIYNEQIRGLYNYFRLANNVTIELNKFYYIMKWSMFHTFAGKYKSTISKMLRKYRIGNTTEFGVSYLTKQGTKIRMLYHDGFKRNQFVEQSEENSKVDYKPNMYKFMGRNELEKRILANKCEYCGKETQCQVHHVNAMKNIRNKNNPLYVLMSARNRKTINLCPECHLKQRKGEI